MTTISQSNTSPMQTQTVQKWLPWLVAMALFMEQLDATVVNTAIPSMATDFGVTPLSLKSVVASYILSLAVGIPVSGWIADKYGTRKVFFIAVSVFTVASVMCGLAVNVPMLVVARLLQGLGAAMMMPVGRSAIVRTFPKSQLLTAMNFVIIPALIGPLLGPTVGGLIVHVASWRYIFFVNVPIGCIALYLIWRQMPDYYGEKSTPLDIKGLFLFATGVAILSWILEVFGEHGMSAATALIWLCIAISLLAAYVWHAQNIPNPLLRMSLFKLRTFRISVLGGFVTRLGIGSLPFLLPLLYQIGLGLPAWQSGLLMMPSALAAMTMKFSSRHILKKWGYRQVLVVNTVLMGVTIISFALIDTHVSHYWIILLGACQGFFNSLQFSSLGSIAYADVEPKDASAASTITSSFQQVSMSFGLAIGSLLASWLLFNLSQTDTVAITTALHKTFIVIGILTIVSSLSFVMLKRNDGQTLSG